jgi:hypothetical protein
MSSDQWTEYSKRFLYLDLIISQEFAGSDDYVRHYVEVNLSLCLTN